MPIVLLNIAAVRGANRLPTNAQIKIVRRASSDAASSKRSSTDPAPKTSNAPSSESTGTGANIAD